MKKSNLNPYGGKQYPPIDVTNEHEMVTEGLRSPAVYPIRRTKKSKEEKLAIKKAKKESSKLSPKSIKQTNTYEAVPKRLVFHVENKEKKKDFKTTYNTTCFKVEVVDLIKNYAIKHKVKVTKIYFNHKLFNQSVKFLHNV